MNIFHKITLTNLKKNKTRTIVTIIGIILSTAMFTAVTSSISSLHAFMKEYTIDTEGSWQGAAFRVTQSESKDFLSHDEIDSSVSLKYIGYANLTDSANQYKPYLYICGVTDDVTTLLPVHITKGRMPENDSELLLPEHLAYDGGIAYNLNDEITLDVGERVDEDGFVLDNNTSLLGNKSEKTKDGKVIPLESITNTESKTYQVVGFYSRPSFESFHAPGYTALTLSSARTSYQDIYFCLHNSKDVSIFLEQNAPYSYTMNYDLLRLDGASMEDSLNRTVTSLAVILIAIIVLGSISLIYNAFSISISERTRQFGLLSSLGATRHQMIHSILFEAAFLCLIGIPLGIFFGLVGIGITFYFTGDTLAILYRSDTTLHLTLQPSVAGIVIAVTLAFITVLISAYLPARKSMKLSALEAIRQTSDINIRSKKVHTFPLTEKLFGFEGMLAAKNYKRSRSKYRATVISLFLSIVLFISASSFCAYLTRSAGSIYNGNGYELSCTIYSENNYDPDTLLTKIRALDGVDKASYGASFAACFTVAKEDCSKEFESFYSDYEQAYYSNTLPADDSYELTALIYFVEDYLFEDYLKEIGENPSDYQNSDHPTGVLIDRLHVFNDKYYDINIFANPSSQDIVLSSLDEDVKNTCTVTAGTFSDTIPFGVSAPSDYAKFIFPYSCKDALWQALSQNPDSTLGNSYYIKTDNHKQVQTDLNTLFDSENISADIYDYMDSIESERAIITVINIFSYGFITLISLIAAANVFNTISTNIILRKREFAMLKSIGLSPKGFRKMMQFECLLYGCKGLLYGLPVSIGITWLIYQAVSDGIDFGFFIPWYSFVIAIGSVFTVVAATMIYSMRKLSSENTMDALKNENL